MAIRKRQERGAYFVLMSAGFVTLLAVAGLGLDLANIYYRRLLIQKSADAAIVAGLAYRVLMGPDVNADEVGAKALEVARQNLLLVDDAAYLDANVTIAAAYNQGGPGAPDSISVNITNNRVGLYLLDKLPLGTQALAPLQLTAQASGNLGAARVALLLDLSGSMCCDAAGTGNCMATGGPGCAVAGQRKADRLRDGAVAFLSAFKDGYDKISLVPYNISANLTRSINTPFDKAGWINAVTALANNPASDTNPSDALIQAYMDANNSGWLGTQDMSWVFFTDGAPTAGRFLAETSGLRFQNSGSDPFNLGPPADPPWADYYNFKDEWNDGIQPPYKGPSALIRTDTCTAANTTDADVRCPDPWAGLPPPPYPWITDYDPFRPYPYNMRFLPYSFQHGNPRGFDGTTAPGMAPCSHHYSSNTVEPTLWHNLTDCFVSDGTDLGFTLRVPFDTNRQYGGNVPMTTERFAEQHYNATLAIADQARSQRGTFYVIGLGQRDPAMVTNGQALDPYQDPNGDDYNRKDYFLTRLALDKDMCDVTNTVGGDLVNSTCNPGSVTRQCCVDPASGGVQYQQSFDVVQGDATGLRSWLDYGVPTSGTGLPVGGPGTFDNPTIYDNRYRFGEYLPTSDANQLTELFRRIARRIQLRLIS